MKSFGKTKLIWIVLGVLAAVSMAQGFVNGLRFVDFHWESAALFLQRENPYQWFFDNRYYCDVIVDATQAPSTVAFLFPYGLVNHFWGNAFWAVSNLLFVAVILICIWKTWFRESPSLAGIIAVIFMIGTPCRCCIGNGQHALFSLAFFMLAYCAMERRWSKTLFGILLAASLFKYTVTVPMAFLFLFRREWKAMFICAGIHIGLTVLLGWWTGCNPIQLVLQSMQIGTMLNPSGGDADIAGLMHSFGVANVKPYAMLGYVFWGVFLFFYSFTGKRDTLLKLATLAVIANVMFYHRIYDFVTLVFPLVYALAHWNEVQRTDLTIRVLVIANVFWSFFAQRALSYFGINAINGPVVYVLEHLLIASLLLKSYMTSSHDKIIDS